MITRTRIRLYIIACLVALAMAEQLTTVHFYYSRSTSGTHVEDRSKVRAGDLVSTVVVDRPLLRWLPFVKYGETVHRHAYQHATGATTLVERDAGTRTQLFVIGLCSTRTFDRLANEPFEKSRVEYLKLRK